MLEHIIHISTRITGVETINTTD